MRTVYCTTPTQSTPQGGVISPCLFNVFLHHVLDEWFEIEVKPRLRGECTLARFADDALMAFDNIVDAKRVLAVLGKTSRTVSTYPPPRQTHLVDFPQRGSTGCAPSGNGWDQLRLPGPDPRSGWVQERQEHGSASDGQGSVCPCSGRGQ